MDCLCNRVVAFLLLVRDLHPRIRQGVNDYWLSTELCVASGQVFTTAKVAVAQIVVKFAGRSG